MNPYHVLAKITKDILDPTLRDGVGVGSFLDQRHFFVKAASPSLAVGIVENLVQQPNEQVKVQFTVKEAVNHGSSGMKPGEEIYSI